MQFPMGKKLNKYLSGRSMCHSAQTLEKCCFDISKSLLAWPLLYSITKQSKSLSQIFLWKCRYLPIKWLSWWAQSEAFMFVNILDLFTQTGQSFFILGYIPSSDLHMGQGRTKCHHQKPTSLTYEWSYGLVTYFSVLPKPPCNLQVLQHMVRPNTHTNTFWHYKMKVAWHFSHLDMPLQ